MLRCGNGTTQTDTVGTIRNCVGDTRHRSAGGIFADHRHMGHGADSGHFLVLRLTFLFFALSDLGANLISTTA